MEMKIIMKIKKKMRKMNNINIFLKKLNLYLYNELLNLNILNK